jgi:hypothetical protein
MTATEKAALSRELADFLIELSIALHKHTMYPEGHPSLEPAVVAVARRAEHLFEGRTTLALGVARNQLVIEGVATDPRNPLLAELAGRLHRHHLGAVTFQRGLRVNELSDALRTLAVDAERSGEPIGLGPPQALRAWDHLRLHPVTYDRLELLDEEGEPASGGGDDKDGRARELRGAQLWVGLARAALTAESPGADEPSVIARAIDEHPESPAYDQVIVGYLLQIADELKHTGGAEAAALRRRTSKLVGALQPGTLRRLIEMGGDAAQRAKFAIDATHGLAVDAVLDIVRAMADASHRSVSDPLVRMLSKLAQHAERGTAEARQRADESLREQVRGLLRGWTLEDPNPAEYGTALHNMTAATPPAGVQRSLATQEAEPLRILQTAVEAGVLGFAAWRAVERIVAEHHVDQLVALLAESPEASRPAGRADIAPLWTRVTAPDVVRQLASEPPDFVTIDRVLPRLSVGSFEPLLDVLAASESRTTRRNLLDRLTRAPRELGAVIAAWLSGGIPWYVARNLLLILDGLPALPAGFSTAPFIAHADVRVRREAVKLALKIPAERESAVLGALRDTDPRMVRLALTAVLEDCPSAALESVTRIARDPATVPELRVLAIKVLGRARTPLALATLLQLVDGGTNWLGRRRLAPRSLESLAALMALASGWAADPQARTLLALAAGSADPDIRNAAAAGVRAPKP